MLKPLPHKCLLLKRHLKISFNQNFSPSKLLSFFFFFSRRVVLGTGLVLGRFHLSQWAKKALFIYQPLHSQNSTVPPPVFQP